jgi:hypothetical protein
VQREVDEQFPGVQPKPWYRVTVLVEDGRLAEQSDRYLASGCLLGFPPADLGLDIGGPWAGVRCCRRLYVGFSRGTAVAGGRREDLCRGLTGVGFSQDVEQLDGGGDVEGGDPSDTELLVPRLCDA